MPNQPFNTKREVILQFEKISETCVPQEEIDFSNFAKVPFTLSNVNPC